MAFLAIVYGLLICCEGSLNIDCSHSDFISPFSTFQKSFMENSRTPANFGAQQIFCNRFLKSKKKDGKSLWLMSTFKGPSQHIKRP